LSPNKCNDIMQVSLVLMLICSTDATWKLKWTTGRSVALHRSKCYCYFTKYPPYRIVVCNYPCINKLQI